MAICSTIFNYLGRFEQVRKWNIFILKYLALDLPAKL
jgi:hypothetical protein